MNASITSRKVLMNLRTLLLLLFVSMATHAQTPSVPPSPNLDVYANFVGDWVGTVQELDHGVIVTTPVELRVTESRKKDSMRFDYKFGRKSENHYMDISRVITLNPETSKVTSLYTGGDGKKDVNEATGLAKFAETGYGVFAFSRTLHASPGGTDVWSTHPFYRCTFSLKPNTFSYQPEISSDGKTFMPTSVYTFTHKTSNATDPETKQTAAEKEGGK
jgi:hypothetical protein